MAICMYWNKGRVGVWRILNRNWCASNTMVGNRKPLVVASASTSAGAVPLNVKFSSDGTKDYDNDSLKHERNITNAAGAIVTKLTDANPSYEFKVPGNYKVKVKATDSKGLSETKDFVISAGNEPPVVSLSLAGGNQSFFFPIKRSLTKLKCPDKEDGSLDDKRIPASSVRITANYQDGDGSAAGRTPGSAHYFRSR